jgi:hypothetical protein
MSYRYGPSDPASGVRAPGDIAGNQQHGAVGSGGVVGGTD